MDAIKFKIAVLIDGDNAQPKLIQEILEEVSKHGKATTRRIYGDWTLQTMNGWKDTINKYSFSPVQKFSYTTGKNSTDSALIIDAMDILHGKNIDGFCIVSSDSDYTGLAKRIREEGMFVMGIGEKKTPEAFVQSCEVFTFCENIGVNTITAKTTVKRNKKEPEETVIDTSTIDKAFEISRNEEDAVYVSTLGFNIRKINPSFDARSYGFKSLTELVEKLEKYEVHRDGKDNHPIIKLKSKKV